MFGLFKRKSQLIAKTDIPGLNEKFPVVEAKKFHPSWYKAMDMSFERGKCPVKTIANMNTTVKGCYGVKTLLRSGFIVRAWSDMSILVYPNGVIGFATACPNKDTHKVHDLREAPPFLQDKVIIKLHNPWFFYGDDTQYMYVPTSYHSHYSREHYMPHGIVEFKHQHRLHIFLCVEKRAETYEILIRAGDPLGQIIPITDKKVTLKTEFQEKLLNDSNSNFYFIHPYHRGKAENIANEE